MKTIPLFLILALALSVVTAGCGSDAEVARIATQAADRQAQQNEEMSRVNREVAAGTKNLVEADAQARKELIAAQQQLQSQQTEIGNARNQLEAERQENARHRQTVSLWTPVIQGLGVVLVAVLTLGLCWKLLHGLRSDDDANQELGELLIRELSASQQRLTSNHRDEGIAMRFGDPVAGPLAPLSAPEDPPSET